MKKIITGCFLGLFLIIGYANLLPPKDNQNAITTELNQILKPYNLKKSGAFSDKNQGEYFYVKNGVYYITEHKGSEFHIEKNVSFSQCTNKHILERYEPWRIDPKEDTPIKESLKGKKDFKNWQELFTYFKNKKIDMGEGIGMKQFYGGAEKISPNLIFLNIDYWQGNSSIDMIGYNSNTNTCFYAKDISSKVFMDLNLDDGKFKEIFTKLFNLSTN